MNQPAAQAPVRMYTTQFCPYCIAAKRLFDSLNVQFEEIAVDGQPQLRQQMLAESGQRTVPQIWIGDTHVGGCDDLHRIYQQGELDALLQP